MTDRTDHWSKPLNNTRAFDLGSKRALHSPFHFLHQPTLLPAYFYMDVKLVSTDLRKPAAAKPTWRSMSLHDLESLIRIADKIHPGLPESNEVFAERIKLFPEGCLALTTSDDKELCGYVISHPVRRRQPPALDSLLGEIHPEADQYYIHDLAILPTARGHGLAQECIHRLFAVAKRFPTTSLVSVYNTTSFWGRFGFLPGEADEGLEKKLRGYGDDATYLERKNEGH